MDTLNSLMLAIFVDINSAWATVVVVMKWIMLVLMGLSAIFIISVILFQPGSSTGIGALGGQTETFLNKNKNKTKEGKMKKYTIIASILMAVFCIAFYVLSQVQIVG